MTMTKPVAANRDNKQPFNFSVGIDLGGTHFVVGIVDRSGTIQAKNSRPTHSERSFEEIVQEIAETVKLSLEQAGLTVRDIAGTGLGVPSNVDPKTKRLIFAHNLFWADKDLVAEYGKHISGPVYIDNDADCAALGEVLTDPEACKNALMLTFGTGIGGALVIDGKLFRGCDGFGIEPGHIVLIHGGRECTCGLFGCFEAYCSASALVEQTKVKMAANPQSLMWKTCVDPSSRPDLNRADGKTAFIAARQGDPTAQELLQVFFNRAGHAIGSLIALFRPEKVIIGGGLSNEGDHLIKPLYEAVKRHTFGAGLMPVPPLTRARLGNDAGIVGAAMLAMNG